MKTAAIIGAVAGAATLCILLLLCIFFLRRNRQTQTPGFFPSFEPKPRKQDRIRDEELQPLSPTTPNSPPNRYLPSNHYSHHLSASDNPTRHDFLPSMTFLGSELDIISHQVTRPTPDKRGGLVISTQGTGSADMSSTTVYDHTSGCTHQEGIAGSPGHHKSVVDSGKGGGHLSLSCAGNSSLAGAAIETQASTDSELGASPYTLSRPARSPFLSTSTSSTSLRSFQSGGTEVRNWLDRSPRKIDLSSSLSRPTVARITPRISSRMPITKLL
jgi:hypothetical protein